jgi:hypothetical protein
MKMNLFKTVTLGLIMTAATGCLENKSEEVVQAPPSPRDALMKALENQGNGLIQSFNKVLVDSQFLKNLDPENPPQPITIEDEQEVRKAIEYLLSNAFANSGSIMYSPDTRICAEVVAKNEPASCEDVMSQITLTQIEQDATSGYVQVRVANLEFFSFAYTSELISVQADLSKALASLQKIEDIIAQHNVPSDEELPSMAQGSVSLTVAQKAGATIIDLTINQAIKIQGKNNEGNDYAFDISAGQNVITASIYPLMGLAAVATKLPQADLTFPVYDYNNISHAVKVAFPGASGVATLNNAMSMLDLSGVSLAAQSVSATVDGQTLGTLTVNGQLDAQIISSVGGHVNAKFLSSLQAQLEVTSNPLFSEAGGITAAVAQDTELYFAKDSEQAKVISGSLSFVGSGDFLANMNATAGMCIQGDENQDLYLETAVCQ